jgi:hypothetical protein
MKEPTAKHILNLRRAYILPFWRIEAVAERWYFDVAQASFDAGEIPMEEAANFQQRWRGKVIGEGLPRRDGTIFIPLQGRLTDHRSFQSMSPVAMIETTLDQIRDKTVVATLHPKESYSAKELDALDALERRFPRFRVMRKPMPGLLLRCDAVVTQNSSVALHGFLANKPAVLFAQSDFHHIAGSVPRDGVAAAFESLNGPRPSFARYVTWFLRRQAINGGAPECEEQIVARFRRHGWDL